MDYPSLHGQDISNFSSSSPRKAPVLLSKTLSTSDKPDRMPTVSAAQALQDLKSQSTQCISTGLQGLDAALQNRDAALAEKEALRGGVSRGQVTDIYGPPGVGKTALGIQLAANALRAHQGVIWVDAAQPFPGPRLREALSCSPPSRDAGSTEGPPSTAEFLQNLTCFTTPTLPHLIALLCHTAPSFPHQDTSLIVIDSFSTLVASAYPRNPDTTSINRGQGTTPKYSPQQWAAARKWSVFQFVISSLQKLATLRNVAIVILNQIVTKMKSGSRAILIPAISSTAWDAGIATRMVLFRDWGWEEKHVRFAKVVKAGGVIAASSEKRENVVTFTIESHGLKEAHRPHPSETLGVRILALLPRKRKADEILDSEDDDGSDEDYGWAEEDDEELPQPPPQWQGSEDILVPRAEQMGEEDDEEEEDEQEEEEGKGYGGASGDEE